MVKARIGSNKNLREPSPTSFINCRFERRSNNKSMAYDRLITLQVRYDMPTNGLTNTDGTQSSPCNDTNRGM